MVPLEPQVVIGEPYKDVVHGGTELYQSLNMISRKRPMTTQNKQRQAAATKKMMNRPESSHFSMPEQA